MTLGAVAVFMLLGAAPAASSATAASATPVQAVTASGVEVTHDPAPCLLAGRAARIEARIEPDRDDVRARVLFRSEGEGRFYSVPMEREGAAWVGVLPRPAAATSRIAYSIDVTAGGSHRRLPSASAFLVDVVNAPCSEGNLPVSATGPSEVGVPPGAPRVPPGFEQAGIEAFVEDPGDQPPTPPRAAAMTPLAVQPIASGSTVRAVTSPGERRAEGKLVSVDAESLVLDDGKDRIRIPRNQLLSLEVREKGSSGMRVLGGLGGAVAGLAVTALICASGDSCESVAVLWAGTGLGAVAGAALVGGGSWKPVTLATAGPVAVDLQVRQAAAGPAAGVRLRVGF